MQASGRGDRTGGKGGVREGISYHIVFFYYLLACLLGGGCMYKLRMDR